MREFLGKEESFLDTVPPCGDQVAKWSPEEV